MIRSTKPIIFISFLDVSYVTISSNYFCKHTNGGFPTRCALQGANLPESCQDECSSYSWCIGYSQRNGYCGLITSTDNITCAGGKMQSDGYTATTTGQLEASMAGGFNCVVKASTGNKRL